MTIEKTVMKRGANKVKGKVERGESSKTKKTMSQNTRRREKALKEDLNIRNWRTAQSEKKRREKETERGSLAANLAESVDKERR